MKREYARSRRGFCLGGCAFASGRFATIPPALRATPLYTRGARHGEKAGAPPFTQGGGRTLVPPAVILSERSESKNLVLNLRSFASLRMTSW